VAAAENPAVLAGHEIGREFRAAHEGQLGVRHQQQFAVLVVEVHAQHAAHAGGVDRQLAAALFFQRPALLQGQQVEEIGDPEEHFVGHGPAGDFFEHEEDGFVVGDQAQHDVVRHASDGMPRAAEFELDPHRHLPGQGPLAPVARQDQVQRAVARAGRARFRALEEGLRGDLAQMARAAFSSWILRSRSGSSWRASSARPRAMTWAQMMRAPRCRGTDTGFRRRGPAGSARRS
jgi:hypothetical protein